MRSDYTLMTLNDISQVQERAIFKFKDVYHNEKQSVLVDFQLTEKITAEDGKNQIPKPFILSKRRHLYPIFVI